MGKKPGMGIVSAFCVGLALTGCRDANTRSDAPPQMTKATTSPYKAPPTFGPSAPSTASQANGWNVPPTAATTGMTAPDAPPAPALTGAGSKPMDSMSLTTPASPGVQPAGGMASAPIAPAPPPAPMPPDGSSRFGPSPDIAPAGASSSNFPPPGDVAPAGGRVLPPTPALQALPPLPSAEAPTPPAPVGDSAVPPAPSSLPMSRSSLPPDLGPAPAPSPAPAAYPSPLPPPAPGPMLPPPPPVAPGN